MKLRRASLEDADELMTILVAMHDEIALAPMSPQKVSDVLIDALANGVVLVVEHAGQIVGTAGCQIGTPWWSDKKQLSERWVYVRPDKRRGVHPPVAVTLLRSLKEIARRLELPLAIGIYNTRQTERKNALYRRFFTPVGEMFYEEPG